MIMEKKPSIFRVFFFILSIFFTNVVIAQKTTISIRVGVVLDMNNPVGEMALNCIEMALSDFYAAHGHYKTRLVLNSKDSNDSVVGAAAAALDLLKNSEVQAIIGPLFSVQANFMIELGDKVQVPIITFAATSPFLSSIKTPYFIRATLSDSSQVDVIGAIIQAFGFREVVPIYVDNEFGEGILPYLIDAMVKVNVQVPYRSVIPLLATDDQIVAELYKLMTMQTRVFVVHMLVPLGFRLFAKARELGMMTEGYAWIITDSITSMLNSVDSSVLESMLGVIGVTPYIPKTSELDTFAIQYKKRLLLKNPPALGPVLNAFGLRAYDSAITLAIAVERAQLTNARFKKQIVSVNSTDLEAFGVSSGGPKLIQALSSTVFKGLAGDFVLVERQLKAPPYQIVNVIGPAFRGVGYWTKKNGLVKELNFTTTRTKSNLGPIIWPGDTTTPPKGWVIPTNGKQLRVGVPVKDGFTEFLKVTWNPDNSTKVEGWCRDIFDAVMAALPYGVSYEYIPFAKPDHEIAGSYNDLVYQVYLGKYDAVVGDVTIIANRSQYVDFTLPYSESGVSMVVPLRVDKSQHPLVFLQPLTWKLWVTSFCSFVLMGILTWILEHRINKEFRGSPWHQVGIIFWFAFSTMVFAQKEKVISNSAKIVLLMWFLVVLILTQSYTASLASMLTVQKLQPTVTDVSVLIKNKENVGYQEGSFVFGFLKKMKFDKSQLWTYNSTEQMDELLSKGSKNGGIAAVFDEIPYIKMFLAKYRSKYTMVGPRYKTDGFGFVFPMASPLAPDVSRAILNVTENEKMVKIDRKWFQDENTFSTSNAALSSQSLGLESFWGLFLIVGMAGAAVFTFYLTTFFHQNWDVVAQAGPNETTWDVVFGLLRRFYDRDPKAPDFSREGNGR